MNLIAKDLLGDAEFAESVQQASKAVNDVNASPYKWLQRMNTCQCQTYGCVWALMSLATTRRNSMKMCLASQLQVRKALQLFATLHKDDPEFPIECKCWRNTDWWKLLDKAENAVRPLSEASFLMQRDGNTLAHLFLMYENLYRHFAKIRLRGDDYVEANIQGDSLVRIIEKRWRKEEPHLFFLGFCVHPAFSKTASSYCVKLYKYK